MRDATLYRICKRVSIYIYVYTANNVGIHPKSLRRYYECIDNWKVNNNLEPPVDSNAESVRLYPHGTSGQVAVEPLLISISVSRNMNCGVTTTTAITGKKYIYMLTECRCMLMMIIMKHRTVELGKSLARSRHSNKYHVKELTNSPR